jgi:hypothetical protein
VLPTVSIAVTGAAAAGAGAGAGAAAVLLPALTLPQQTLSANKKILKTTKTRC